MSTPNKEALRSLNLFKQRWERVYYSMRMLVDEGKQDNRFSVPSNLPGSKWDRYNERCGHFGDFSKESFQAYVLQQSETKPPVKALCSLSSKWLRLVCLAFTRNQVFWQRGSHKLLKNGRQKQVAKSPRGWIWLILFHYLSGLSAPPCDFI